MSIRVAVLGPHGSGKSTLVRRVMSLYESRQRLPGGVGELPNGYLLSRTVGTTDVVDERRLIVLGNYETTGRDHHGMKMFDRYHSNFLQALRYANTQKDPVLCEGGFLKPRRLAGMIGAAFSSSLVVVWIEDPLSRSRWRKDTGSDSFEKNKNLQLETIDVMCDYGAQFYVVNTPDEGLDVVCGLIDTSLDTAHAKPDNLRL